MMQGEAVSSVRVLYNFDYTTKDGRLVSIRQAEKLHLLKRTNADWWQVRRDADAKPFYVPAVYVREVPPAFIPPPHEYTNVPTTAGCCQHQQERRQLNSVLRNELITGNYGLRDVSALDKAANRFADKKVLGEMTPGVRRNYSVIAPSGPKKPVPCPRSVHPLSKSLETLAEEIQFAPSTPLWRIEQTSDYHTPSPDYLDASVEDMFWRRNNSTRGDANSGVQRSSSFKFRNFKRHNAPADDSDSVASRSLESLVDSGAEACSSSSYEWDRTPDDTATESVPPRVTIPKAALAFKNQTYQSTDDEDSDSSHVCGRPRSSSDTGLSVDSRRETRLSRSESHKVYSHKEQLDKPLIALKRNQKLVGCRRRPAILCLPSKNSPLNDDDDADEAPRGRRRPPKCPPSPAPHEKPLRVLPGGWAEFYCSDAGGVGRIYYFHGITGQRSWKPPRVKKIGRDGGQSDKSDSELRSGRESSTAGRSSRSPSPRTSNFVLPPGWNEHYDDEEQQSFYVHKTTGAKYFSSSDNEGRLYFFAENSTESTWSLPKSPPAPKAAPPPPESAPPPKTSPLARGHANTPLGVVPVLRRFEQQEESPTEETDGSSQGSLNHQAKPRKTMGPFVLPPLPNARASKSQSMLVPDIKTPPVECIGMDTQTKAPWSLITDSGQCLIKEGPLLRAKIMEGGKKVKKNWSQAYVLLTDMRMLFFKDTKTYNAMRDNCANVQVEMSLDLQNADIQKADKDSSSRKNAFLISNHVLQVLCQQDENIEAADGWFYTTSLTIRNLSQHLGTMTRISKSRENSPHRGSVSPEAPRTGSMQRAKSVKVKKDSESVEDLSGESHTKIKAGLKKFFKRRPTMESLVKKGIWKDEPAFGSSLAKLCADCSPGPIPQIPRFVKACIEAIERNPEHMKTDGIYRASGNLSQVQRIRLHVDQNKLEVLDQEEEVHVLTGALKLFFRELKEPLIPFDAFQKAMDINNLKDKREKLRLFRDLVQNLPRPNHDTLKYLLEHLLRVTANQSFNRMHIPNLAIVFGPTLMWPEQESMEMALTLMQQNVVIECLLQEFDSIFK